MPQDVKNLIVKLVQVSRKPLARALVTVKITNRFRTDQSKLCFIQGAAPSTRVNPTLPTTYGLPEVKRRTKGVHQKHGLAQLGI